MSLTTLLTQPFGTLSEAVRAAAAERPAHPALVHDERVLSYAELDRLVDRVAAGLQREAVVPGRPVAICAATSFEYVAAFLGALRAGAAATPLPASALAATLARMTCDAAPGVVFADAALGSARDAIAAAWQCPWVALDGSAVGTAFVDWLARPDAVPAPVEVAPQAVFNILYSSGTTGTPKGIVQSHAMRWQHVQRLDPGPDPVSLISTPLYSNTTLVSLVPTLARGGTCVLMARFDAASFLALAQRHRVTHAMLVPVQIRRLLGHPGFDDYDLTSFRTKLVTSAPFSAALKAETLRRWPGGLIEIYGMTEGGGACMLAAHEHPDKLHTVGRPALSSDLRIIDEHGRELAPGETGEIVGRSPGMMLGYHNRPEATRDAEWFDAEGRRYIRSGDIGRFDTDGFLTLLDRRKDMIISGGFNVYPSDLEAVLAHHESVAESAVVGVASERWGETPVAAVVPKPGMRIDPEALRAWANERLGAQQRLAAITVLDALPRSAIGKILKRELRERFGTPPAGASSP